VGTRALAHLLATHSRATLKQAKKPNIPMTKKKMSMQPIQTRNVFDLRTKTECYDKNIALDDKIE
jgi:hypothetical protein